VLWLAARALVPAVPEGGVVSRTNRDPRGRRAPVGQRPYQSPMDVGLNVTAGDVRPMLAILAGDSVLTTHLKWQDEARCAEIGPEPFFLEVGSNGRVARSVCASCPVRRSCLLDALEHMDDYGAGRSGIWGSTSPEQREYFLKLHHGDAGAALEYAMRCDPLDDSKTPQPQEVAA
jgi:WhiB family redox-sensing transcriptional regulator